MRDSTLKDFFHGDLAPADRQMIAGSEIARMTAKASEAEQALGQALTPELKPLLDRLVKAQSAMCRLSVEEHYIDGFKTGARFMMEILDDRYENLKPIAG